MINNVVRFFFNFAVSVTMEKSKLRVILEYECRRSTNAAQMASNINDKSGTGTAIQPTVRFRFDHFRSGNNDLNNAARSQPQTKVDYNQLRAIVEAYLSQSTSELAAAFNVNNIDSLTSNWKNKKGRCNMNSLNNKIASKLALTCWTGTQMRGFWIGLSLVIRSGSCMIVAQHITYHTYVQHIKVCTRPPQDPNNETYGGQTVCLYEISEH